MNNVILVGYMGCGKTTVGIRLSYRLKIPFLDTDKKIEKDHNCVISDVFATINCRRRSRCANAQWNH